MKARNGFVSNSSSSSFIVSANSNKQIAKQMIGAILEEHPKKKELKKAFTQHLKKIDDYQPILIPYGYEDTLIHHYRNDEFVVETCCNIRWEEIINLPIGQQNCSIDDLKIFSEDEIREIKTKLKFLDVSDGNFKTVKQSWAERGYCYEYPMRNKHPRKTDIKEIEAFLKSVFGLEYIFKIEKCESNSPEGYEWEVQLIEMVKGKEKILHNFYITNFWEIKDKIMPNTDFRQYASIFSHPSFGIIRYVELLLAYEFIKEERI